MTATSQAKTDECPPNFAPPMCWKTSMLDRCARGEGRGPDVGIALARAPNLRISCHRAEVLGFEALCHRWPWPIPAGKRPTSVDRPQTVRSRIGELHEKSSLFIRPSRCEKVAAACQRLLLSHSAALP